MSDEPISISWSSLKTYSECKQKAYLQRTGHKNPAQDIRGYYHGTVSDRVMRKWLESEDPRSGQMERWVDQLIDQGIQEAKESGEGVVRWKSATDRAEMTQYCIELVRRLEPILEKEVLPFDFISAYRFKVPVQVPWLDGTPTWIYLIGEYDLAVYDDGYIVWDLKATRDDQYWRKTLGQLIFYDLSIGAEYGEFTKKVGLIQPMCQNRTPEWVVSDEARQEMWARIHRMATDIWLKDHSPKVDSVGCTYCPVRHSCEKFKTRLVVDSKGKRRMSFGGLNELG